MQGIVIQTYISSEKFENGAFTLKINQLFSVHATPNKFKKLSNITFVSEENQEREIIYRYFTVIEDLRFQNIFRQYENAKSAFSNSPA